MSALDDISSPWATADELREILGPNWAIARGTPKNKARYDNCITKKRYDEAEKEALRRRRARAS